MTKYSFACSIFSRSCLDLVSVEASESKRVPLRHVSCFNLCQCFFGALTQFSSKVNCHPSRMAYCLGSSFFLGLAIYLASWDSLQNTQRWTYTYKWYFIFSVAAVIPYDFTNGLILIILFFCAIPFHAITRINIENATNKENDLDNIRGLWRTLRSKRYVHSSLFP